MYRILIVIILLGVFVAFFFATPYFTDKWCNEHGYYQVGKDEEKELFNG